jgi:putative intracellular protease/amidase
VKGKSVTGFSNTEEDAVQLTEVVPFLLEDMLKSNQGFYRKGADWESHVEVDGNRLTGQNPASSEAVAHEMISQLLKKQG